MVFTRHPASKKSCRTGHLFRLFFLGTWLSCFVSIITLAENQHPDASTSKLLVTASFKGFHCIPKTTSLTRIIDYSVKLFVQIKNTGEDNCIFWLSPHSNNKYIGRVDGEQITEKEAVDSSSVYEYHFEHWASNDTSSEVAAIRDSMNRPAPPGERFVIIHPNETIEMEPEIIIHVEPKPVANRNVYRLADVILWDQTREEEKSFWMKIEIESWHPNLEEPETNPWYRCDRAKMLMKNDGPSLRMSEIIDFSTKDQRAQNRKCL